MRALDIAAQEHIHFARALAMISCRMTMGRRDTAAAADLGARWADLFADRVLPPHARPAPAYR